MTTPPGGTADRWERRPHRRGVWAHATAAPRVDPLSMSERWYFPQSLLCQRAACLSCPPLELSAGGGGGREAMACFLPS